MIIAVIQHIVLLLTFRHDGYGIPGSGPLPYLLLACSGFVSFARTLLETGSVSGAATLVAIGSAVVLICGRKRPQLIAPIALVCIGGDFLSILATLIGLGVVSIAMTIWQVAAIHKFILSLSRSR